MPAKVPCHPLNFGTVAAIFINVVSRYSKSRYRETFSKNGQIVFRPSQNM